MVAVTVLMIPIPYSIEHYFAIQHIEVWTHLPGMVAGIIWTIGAWSISLIITKKSKEVKDKTFTREELREFGIKLIISRLTARYLTTITEAKDKRAAASKMVDEIIKADNKYK